MSESDQPSRVVEIYVAFDQGLPMVQVERVFAIAGIGLEGDRYATGKGAWSKSRVSAIRHVSLIEFEAIEAVRADPKLAGFTAELSRRNIVTRGIRLNELVGKIFRINNGPLLRGVELCTPCGRPGKLSGDTAMRIFLEEALENRGGLRAEVLESGTIEVGNLIRLEP